MHFTGSHFLLQNFSRLGLRRWTSVKEKRKFLKTEKREHSLERLAKRIAREVGQSKVAAKLDPMNSYERRIIHNILTNNKKVYTESEGEEPNRYVVIKPKED